MGENEDVLLVPVRRALVSLSDKTGLDTLAHGLHDRGVELISTGGTATAIEALGVPVTRVESLTGVPEMLDGRVKTLHPAIHAGILANREKPEHMHALEEHGFAPIDLVAVNLYPFEQAVRDTPADDRHAIEHIDVGGPTMLRAAAKNHRGVAVVTDASRLAAVLDQLDAHDGATTLGFRRRLAAATFALLSRYDAAIANEIDGHARGEAGLPLTIGLDRDDGAEALRYGENPHQRAAIYRVRAARTARDADGTSVLGGQHVAGKPLSYNNLNDASAAIRATNDLLRLDGVRSAAAVVKHTNPCGLGIGADKGGTDVLRAALDGDRTAAFGGILAVSSRLTQASADAIVAAAGFLEVIVAPFDGTAIDALVERWPNVRLIDRADFAPTPATPATPQPRSIEHAVLVQDADERLDGPAAWTHAAGPEPAPHALRVAAIAWTAAKHLTSNAVALANIADDGTPMLVGGGAGQMDRVASCEIAVRKADGRAHGAAAGSDAFFPFPDGPQILIDAGVTTIVHPGGSKRDRETFDLCNRRGVTCLTTGTRHFRH